MNKFAENVLETYFESHRQLIDVAEVNSNTAVISLPVYFYANHRIEVSITKLPSGDLQISDMARTIGELKLGGINITQKTLERMTRIARNANIRIVGNNLIRDCKASELGDALHLFADSAKTIGDAYLVHRPKIDTEDELKTKVKDVLVKRRYHFKESQTLKGEVEEHKVDFYIPPNGVPGLALSVLPNPSRLTAEAWVFKSADIKTTNKKLRIGLVYGAETNDLPRKIITSKIEVAIPSSDLSALESGIVPKIV